MAISIPGWVDCGNYIMSTAEQGSEQWHELRDKNVLYPNDIIVTGSQFHEAADIPPFGRSDRLAYAKITRKKKIFPPEALERMKQGSIHEDPIRRLYEKEFNVRVTEVGLAIPKWYPFIGSSLDGIIGEDGCIEIKYVKEIKQPMRDVAARFREDPTWRPSNADHLPQNYYAQMQGGMAITGRKWCDFVVYCHSTNELYTEKIFFNSTYWETFLFPKLRHFREQIVPYIRENLECHHRHFQHEFH